MFRSNLNLNFLKLAGNMNITMSGIMNKKFPLVSSTNMFMQFNKKFYFSYPCPRKLREIVKITLFEREQPGKIKEIWQKYYDEKPHATGFDISADEMKLIIEK